MQGNVIIDLQYGSTGKGLIAGFLAERDKPDTLVTAWAANAGHTYIDREGVKYVHTMLANGIVSPRLKRILIGPGSLINTVSLTNELMANDHLLRGVDVLIHPNAAIIKPEHVAAEAGPMTKIGSTKKGVGEAMIQRIRRDPDKMNVASVALAGSGFFAGMVCSHEEYANALDRSRYLQIEGAQGYSLSIYHGFYPYCTSRDVTTHQVLADCGIPRHIGKQLTVIGTARAFPIRVANRYDDDGKQIGFSGPCYDDQREMEWSELGREAELTTVTKLPRRIFTMSYKQLNDAIRMCGVDELFLNFVNYLPSATDAMQFVEKVDLSLIGHNTRLQYIGLGATAADIFDASAPGNSMAFALSKFVQAHYDKARGYA